MRRLIGVFVVVATVVGIAGVAGAVPPSTNKNILDAGTVMCPEPIGTRTVSFNTRVMSNPIGYTDAGVLIVKHETDIIESLLVTLSSDGTVLASGSMPGPDQDFGKGPTGKLVECTFDVEFNFSGPLDEEFAAELGIDPIYIGEEVDFSFSATGTVFVIEGGPKS